VLFIKTDESIPTIVDPQVSSACVVQYDEDNVWYHGQILKYCDPLGATVLFVDYGNTQLVPVKQIKSIEQKTLLAIGQKKKRRSLKDVLWQNYYPRFSLFEIPEANILCDWWKKQRKQTLPLRRNSERQISPTSHHPVPGIQVAVFLINQSVSSLVGSPSLV
jgi:hypothetical protein